MWLAFHFSVLTVLVLGSNVLRLRATRLRREEKGFSTSNLQPSTAKHVTKRVGKSVKFSFTRKTNVQAATGRWTKNGIQLPQSKFVVFGNGPKTSTLWLKIKNLQPRDAGLYAFVVNDTVVKQWSLAVKTGSSNGQYDHEAPCGRPYPELVSSCNSFTEISHPNCTSFPGKPFNVTVHSGIHQGEIYVLVQWEPPRQGNNDLWGYQVHLVGMDNHPGFYDCVQINDKTQQLHLSFHDVEFGSTYRTTVQSLPSVHSHDRNDVTKKITLPGKCEIEEFKNSTDCCPLVNITDQYNDGEIHLSWMVTSECQEIKDFKVTWNNLQKPESCYGEEDIKGGYNYTVMLTEECSIFNYSVKIYGTTQRHKTRQFSVIVQIPPLASPPAAVQHTTSPGGNTKILIAVVGAVLGLLICVLFAIYRRFFQQVLVKLPVPPSLAPSPDHELLPSDPDKKRVFVIHTRCCQWCSRVLHCFGVLLNSTGLIEASIDMWHELEISPNVPRWYEQQIKSADCVIVLASHKMTLRTLNKVSDGVHMDDPLNIKFQLNLVRGEISQQPDTQKFVPAFFTCSGTKKNVPDFLSTRWSHKLPKEIDRVIFHLLHVEKIQPYRTQSVVVMGGNGHPFDETKKELERAVLQAEAYHTNMEMNQSALQM